MSEGRWVLVSWQGDEADYTPGRLSVATVDEWERYNLTSTLRRWVKIAEGTHDEMARFENLAREQSNE